MRIYSKFKQNYDSGLRYFGEENGIVWQRETKKIYESELPNMPNIDTDLIYKYYHPGKFGSNYIIRFEVIGFCGKFYPLLHVLNHIGYHKITYYIRSPEFFNLSKWYKEYNDYDIDGYIHKLENLDLFKKYNTPLLLLTFSDSEEMFNSPSKLKNWNMLINPDINKYAFEQIFNPYLFFQELEMFIGNILTVNNTPKMPVGSDKVIEYSKGFDKWSFRKMPKKHKK